MSTSGFYGNRRGRDFSELVSMSTLGFIADTQYTLNYCGRYLTRLNLDPRHAFSEEDKNRASAAILYTGPFPIVDTYGGAEAAGASLQFEMPPGSLPRNRCLQPDTFIGAQNGSR